VAKVVHAFAEITGHQPEVLRSAELMRPHEIPVLVGDPSKLIRLSGRAHRRPLAATLTAMLASDSGSRSLHS
jgi:hypothetical protein